MESGNFNSYSSYHNNGPYQESNFSEIAQNIGTNIQKIIQNGEHKLIVSFVLLLR